jgi:hypothetical protein
VNPNYFTDGSRQAVYLTGSHTWNNLVEMSGLSEADTFDYGAWLDFMKKYDHNFMRLWAWELMSWNTGGNREEIPKVHRVFPHPWNRTGPGLASDSLPKFNLEQFNEEYFRRLRERVERAAQKDIYVAIMLFEGWGIQFSPGAWPHHPFFPENNINNLGLDSAVTQTGLEIHELIHPQVLAIQEAYVKKVVETVNNLDNVLYEISNENHPPSTKWQYHMIRFIKDCEKQMPKQHPVGMTFQYKGGRNEDLFNSPADWISPNPEGGYRDDPPANKNHQVIINDTDHLWGLGGNRKWIWKSFLRGMNVLFMDPYDGKILKLPYDQAWADTIRINLGYTRRYANKMNLIRMKPENDLSSTGYCLSDRVEEFLVYLPGSKEAVIDLSGNPGEFSVEWFEPATGTTEAGSSITGGNRITLTSPFTTEDALIYLKKK